MSLLLQNSAFTDWDRIKDEASVIAGEIKQVFILVGRFAFLIKKLT